MSALAPILVELSRRFTRLNRRYDIETIGGEVVECGHRHTSARKLRA